ncbi:YukJ family protein [soil metagenome]
MGLKGGYGVAIGKFSKFTRDSSVVGMYGKYYHGHIHLLTPSRKHLECAIDVSTPEGMPIQYLQRAVDPSAFKMLSKMPQGIHKLASTSSSGALDYVRMKALNAWSQSAWTQTDADHTLDLLEALLKKSMGVMVFGSPYTPPDLGMHNVHMNQGDPIETSHALENAVWQDGGVLIGSARKVVAFLTKFPTQSLRTDSNGHPKP